MDRIRAIRQSGGLWAVQVYRTHQFLWWTWGSWDFFSDPLFGGVSRWPTAEGALAGVVNIQKSIAQEGQIVYPRGKGASDAKGSEASSEETSQEEEKCRKPY